MVMGTCLLKLKPYTDTGLCNDFDTKLFQAKIRKCINCRWWYE